MAEILGLLGERGAVFAVPGDGVERVARHFGDPRGEYRAAVGGCGVVYRADRRLLRVHGRAPRQMLHGIVTNRVPGPPAADGHGREVVYGTILTPKGRMVTDLKTLWLGAGEGEGLGLDVATHGHEAVLGHFTRFMPPRFARVDDLSGQVGLLTVVGPGAEDAVTAAFGRAPAEGYALLDGGPREGGVLVARAVEQVPSWDVWTPAERLPEVWLALEDGGGVPVGWGAWETLRIEAGFPAFGVDMDETTIPVEAGLLDRAFDHGKGCYTGQEVIVRIRHRGRVNWHLRALRFGDAAARPGGQLFEAGGTKVRGRVTSVAESPRFAQAIGLGYVRREVEPPGTLRLGSGEGAEVGVEVVGG